MTTKAAWSQEEWKTIVDAPSMAGLGVMKADFGLLSAAKEFKELIKSQTEAKDKYKGCELIQAIVADLATKSDQTSEASAEAVSLDAIVTQVKNATTWVKQKATADEAALYTKFIVETAERVANASGEGFFGGGPKVSESEEAFLKQVRAAVA